MSRQQELEGLRIFPQRSNRVAEMVETVRLTRTALLQERVEMQTGFTSLAFAAVLLRHRDRWGLRVWDTAPNCWIVDTSYNVTHRHIGY